MALKVTGLNVFPIKSCHALEVTEIQLDSYGVVNDRRFMLVDGNNRFLSQRKVPKLSTVRSKFTTNENGERLLHVSAPGMEKELEFVPVTAGERVEAGVWEDKVMVVDQGDIPSQWFSTFIGHGGTFTRLVASAESEPENIPSDDGFYRVVSNLPPSLKGRLPDRSIALVDAGPVSLVSTESLADVNKRLKERECEEVPLNRFRMNIEISGCSKPFEEDEWLLLRVGTVPFLSYTNAEVTILSTLGRVVTLRGAFVLNGRGFVFFMRPRLTSLACCRKSAWSWLLFRVPSLYSLFRNCIYRVEPLIKDNLSRKVIPKPFFL